MSGYAPSAWAVISPVEILVFCAVVAVIASLLGWAVLQRKRRQYSEKSRRSRQILDRYSERFGLTDEDRATITALSRYLREPVHEYLLVKNQALFDACVAQAHEDGVVAAEAAAAVRLKLPFGSKRQGTRALSSMDLPIGTPVVIRQHGHKLVTGRVLKSPPEGLRLLVAAEHRPFAKQSPVQVLFHDASGAYSFDTSVKAYAGSVVTVAHAERPSPLQRRTEFRKRVYLPAYVKRAGSIDVPVLTHFIDLSSTGAAILNPDRYFTAGEHILLKLHPDSYDYLSVLGKVVRTSKRDSVAHISFENLQPSAQKRLYEYIFHK